MFRRASPDLYRATRFALYAERMMPVLDQMLAIQNGPMDPANAMAKIHAAAAINAIRPVLFPVDDDG